MITMRPVFVFSLLIAASLSHAQARTEVIAQMSGQGKGKAVFKARGNELELQVEGENLRRNTTYRLNLGAGKVVVAVTTNSLGRFSYRRSWRGTQPRFSAGESAVLRSTTNSVVLSGTFRNK